LNIKNLWLALLLAGGTAPAVAAPIDKSDWHTAFPAFRIAGNLYYVGTADLAVYLIATPKGNILINTDFPFDLPLIRQGIERLGFKYRDTKILLISHAHRDHDGATAEVRRETGAVFMVMDADVAEEETPRPWGPGAKVDRVLHDGDRVALGGSVLTAHLTPGHTPGCTTWTMPVQDGGRVLNAVIIGSVNINPGYILVGDREYPRIAEDYARTFQVLRSLPADLYLGAHGGYFDLKRKYQKMKAGDPNAFIDAGGYQAYVVHKQFEFEQEWERQKQHPGSPAP
jgi:metallo-beta-lactamase class B